MNDNPSQPNDNIKENNNSDSNILEEHCENIELAAITPEEDGKSESVNNSEDAQPKNTEEKNEEKDDSVIPADEQKDFEVESADSEGAEETAKIQENPEESESIPTVKKKTHYFLWFILTFFLLCGVAAGYLWNEARQFLDTPPSSTPISKIIFIKPGMTLAQIADLLEKENITCNSYYFQIMTKLKKKSTHIQAGRFLVSTGWLPEKVLDMLLTGKAMLYRLTLREGLPWWAVAEKLEKEGFCRADDFSDIIHDSTFLKHWGIPFPSAEGFLYPETYFLQKPEPDNMNQDAAKSLANRFVETFWKNADKVWKGKRPTQSELQRLVILASIVEKETAVPEERARVAGVYTNRLKINMLLQADPTVIYGLGEGFSGSLLKKHLMDPNNPYNTYQNPGLPPGPICSFGMKALEAAYSPETHDYLYFVATGRDRGHTFSKTLTEHNRAVQNYRRTQKR